MKKPVPDLAAPSQEAARNHRKLVRRGPRPMALEQRFMFDGAAVGTAVDAVQLLDATVDGSARDGQNGLAELVVPVALEPAAERREVAFVDSGIANGQSLVDGIRPGIEVVVLEGMRDGLAQMAEWAASHTGYDAIHVLSHGSQGQVELGSISLNSANLNLHASALEGIGRSLSESGDLLFYGCNIADGQVGIEFVGRLAQATRADIAASSDLTGAAANGGDWVLETNVGAVETSALALDYSGLLAAPADQDFGGVSTGTSASLSLTVGGVVYSTNSGTVSVTQAGSGQFPSFTGFTGNVISTTDSGSYFQFSAANLADNFALNSLTASAWDSLTDHARVYNITGYDGGAGTTATVQVTGFDFRTSGTYGTGASAITYTKLSSSPYIGGQLSFGGGWGNIDTIRLTDAESYGVVLALDTIDFGAPDTTAPTVSAVSSSTANGTYKTGDQIAVTVQFNETVNVTGTPQLTLETGSTDRTISYASGSGSNTLTFNYTVQSGDTSADLDYLSSSALSLNGGTIKDAAGNNATLTLPSPGAANSLAASKAIVVDGVAPSFASAATNTAGTKVILTYGEALSATTAASGAFAVTVGGSSASVSSVSVSGSTVELSLASAVRYGQSVTVAYTDPTSGNDAGAVQDAAGNDAASLASTSATNNARPNVMFDHAYQLFKSGSSTSFSANSTNPDIDPNSASSAVNGVYIDSLRFVASAASTSASGTFQVQGNDVTGTLEFSGTIVNASGVSTASSLTLVGAISKHDKNRDGYTGDSEAFYFFSASNSDASLNGLGFLMITNGSESYFSSTETSISLPADTAYVDTLNAYLNQQSDTTPPTATISLADTALKAGETSVVTITFSEAVSGFTNADLTVANGTLTNVSSSDGGITWTATFTPTADIEDATNVITLANSGVTDAAGNAGSGSTSSANYTIDTLRPTATISLTDTALKVGETSLVTITFSEAVSGFTNADLTVANGTLSTVSSSDGGVTWTATFTPTANLEDTTNVITLANSGVTDAAGNTGSGTTDSGNYAIDTLRPTATISLADTALKVGETSLVTITFSEAVSGFTNADLSIANGTLSTVSSSDGGVTWTATFTPTANLEDTTNVVTLANSGVTDAAGNAGSGSASSANYTIDTLRPTIAIASDKSSLKAGESATLTFTLSEAASDFAASDIAVSGGTLSGFTGSGTSYSASFTPDASSIADGVISVASTKFADAAGNANADGADADNTLRLTVDTLRPTASIALADTSLKVGETSMVTITFSEAVTGLTNADLTVANGTLTNVSSSDGGVTWTATFTPTADIEDATNVITLTNSGVTDAAGNTGSGTTDSSNYAIDTLRPTATITLADTALKVGETSMVTITFSEAVTGLTNADLTVANGTLTNVSSSDGGVTWTATFTPTADIEDATNVITLTNSGVTDAAGNAGSGSASSANYTIDTLRPTIAIASDKSSLKAGESATLTFTLSEAASDFAASDIAVSGGTLSGFTGSGTSYSASFTPDANSIASGVISVASSKFSDAAGNANTDGADANNTVTLTVDTLRPTATISLADTALKAGDTSLVTITFSEAVSGFTNADLTVANGTLSTVSSSDGGVTWTATFTPTANLEDTSNVITLANSGVTDAAGNAGSGSASSANYTIDTLRPTIAIASDKSSLKAGESATLTFTLSEAASDFTASDIAVSGGTLSGFTGSGSSYSASFTPDANSIASGVISVASSKFSDAAGNANTDGADANNTVTLTVDTVIVTVSEPVVNEASPYAVFTVVGVQGQVMALALADGEAKGGGTDFGAAGSGNLEVSLDGGSTWAAYSAAVMLPAGGAVLVRTPVVEDGLRDNNETFTLTATPLAGTAASGRGTIRDDGTGSLFKEDGSIDAEAVGSDDRPVSVSSPRVNEASLHAVFSVTGAAGQRVRLALTAETASGDGVDFGASLQVSTDGGASWSSYVGAVALSAKGGLLVRTPVVDDGIADQGETFRLTATPVGGVAAEGRALLDDQGAGLVFGEDGAPDADAVLDDERPLTVSSLTVSEASPYAVFTVTGAAGQRVGLALASGTATVGTDTGAALEYFDGTRWQAYEPGSLVTIPAGGDTLLVRVAIVNDNAFEGAESFQLLARNTAGALSSGAATVRDDGLSSAAFTADSLSGTPTAGASDDDMPKPLPPAPAVAPAPAALPPEPAAAPAQEPGPQVFSADPAADATAPATGFLPPSGELLTNASGFRVVVSEAPSPSLTVFRGITDQFVEGSRPASFALPHDAFTHSRADAVVTLEARHADGTVLPPWFQFDARAGTFQIDPPAGFSGELQIMVTARDSEGREASTMFRFNVGGAKPGVAGRSSLSEQLRLAAKRPAPWLDLVRAQQAQRMTPREAPAARARA